MRKLLSIILAVLMVFSVFATSITAFAATEITNIEVTGVTAPVIGEAANHNFNIPSDAGYAVGDNYHYSAWAITSFYPEDYDDLVSATWYYENDGLVFEDGYYYTFIAFVHETDGYEFASNVTSTINGENASNNEWQDGFIDVWTTYLCATNVIDKIEVTDVTAPVMAQAPLFNYSIPDNAGYQQFQDLSFGIWVETDTYPETFEDVYEGSAVNPTNVGDAVFRPNKYYTFVTFLVIDEGAVLAQNATTTISGNEAKCELIDDGLFYFYSTFYCSPTVEIPIQKIVNQGGNVAPGSQTFSFEAFDYAFIPDEYVGAIEIKSGSVQTNGAGTFDGTIKFDIEDLDMLYYFTEGGFFIREKNDNAENWTYSDQTYFVYYDLDNGWTVCQPFDADAEVIEAPIPVDVASFTNTFTKTVIQNQTQEPNDKDNKDDNKTSNLEDSSLKSPDTGSQAFAGIAFVMLAAGVAVLSTLKIAKKAKK